MNLSEKFEKGEIFHTYQRIDSEYHVNIFLGYNESGQMSMVITENGKESDIKSSKVINVKMTRRDDNKLAFSFDLLDNSYTSMFIIFCKDIILTCEKAGRDMAISSALIRWKYWKEMFGKSKQNILEKIAIKGLIGELIVLRDYFMQTKDENTAIASWLGPLLGHKDFEIDKTWYEIKTINQNSVSVTISSLEQLESDFEGHLVIVRLEDTSTVSSKSININQIVISIVEKITDPDNMNLFLMKLGNVGYEFDTEYENYNFMYKGKETYIVGNEFPRLRRKEINQSIGNVKYTIMINGIMQFREE